MPQKISWSADGRARAAPGAAVPGHGRRAGLARVILAGSCLFLLGAAAFAFAPASDGAGAPVDVAAAPAAPPKPAWRPIIHPLRLYTLEARDLAKLPVDYEARRSTEEGGREDDLIFGAAARGDAPFMRVAVHRVGDDAKKPAPFFVDLTLDAAASGLAVTKMTPSTPLPTKFGPMRTAEIDLAMPPAVERSCLAFRHAVAGSPVRISGWFCAPAGAGVARSAFGCLLDRLELLSAGEDVGLRRSFVAAEERRRLCADRPVVTALASAPAKPRRLAMRSHDRGIGRGTRRR